MATVLSVWLRTAAPRIHVLLLGGCRDLKKKKNLKKVFKFIYFEKDREIAWMQEEQKDRETKKIPSRLHTVSAGEPDAGLEPTKP